MAKKQRTDADRRVRQCERLARLLRLLHLITGKGRWDANTLAEELECSRRTVYRLLQTLSMAGVPWYFDETCRAYRVRPGFRFSLIEPAKTTADSNKMTSPVSAIANENLIRKCEELISALQAFLTSVK